MNEPVKNTLFESDGNLDPAKKMNILQRFASCDQLDLFFENDSRIIFSYNPYKYAHEFIISEMRSMGISEAPKKKKSIFRRFLENLARDNKAAVGDCSLNCCSFGSQKSDQ